MAIIPLLSLQVLDCYEWTCLLYSRYCGENRDPYRLSLDQSVVTICYGIAVFVVQGFANIAKDKLKSTLCYPEIKEVCCQCCETDTNESSSTHQNNSYNPNK